VHSAEKPGAQSGSDNGPIRRLVLLVIVDFTDSSHRL